MTVPLMIWSTRNVIDSTACSSAISAPPASAAITASARFWVYTPVMKPTNADVSIRPSMAMLTTPVRSEQMPASAPSVIGVALVIVTARIEIDDRLAEAQARGHDQDQRQRDPEADRDPGARNTSSARASDRRRGRAHVSALPHMEPSCTSPATASASRGTRMR